ncbi:Hypothetical protein, putative [Bodo saltans]|uniref:Uncharacterized protein n=1 Tax=Bodo saltans TaxID=75058 RepID=A0A0S4J4Y0_BODSA|nr:Hypothetical protein, putative [Bodo saltans]|eukprot:CUG79289.1 Hypothetical protein, putative [Bodo saltans]
MELEQRLESKILTVAFPGFGASRSQLAKYTGSDGVVVLSPSKDTCDSKIEPPTHSLWMVQALDNLGESTKSRVLYHAFCDKASRLLYNMLPCPEVAELETGSWSWNPLHWPTMVKSRGAAWYFSLHGVPTSYMKLEKVNLAGFDDQADCLREIARGAAVVAQEGKGRKLVLFGCSRGATTTCFAALRLAPDIAQYVGLVLLEAPFDTLENVVKESSWTPQLVMSLVKNLGKYDGDSGAYELPLNTHLRCPIAFITSKVDTRVPESCTRRLIDSIKVAYPELEIHHLQLHHSSHATMPIGHSDDRAAYINFVHSLYEQCLIS